MSGKLTAESQFRSLTPQMKQSDPLLWYWLYFMSFMIGACCIVIIGLLIFPATRDIAREGFTSLWTERREILNAARDGWKEAFKLYFLPLRVTWRVICTGCSTAWKAVGFRK